MAKVLKEKKCRHCKESFLPKYPLQVVCSVTCAVEYNKSKKQKESEKEWNHKKRELKEKLKTKKDHLKDLQTVFNEYIRKRDKDKLCICCDKPLTKVYHAGHFFSVGAYPNLRFNEDNCHAQREDCNLHKHGNHAEYALRLPKRIGEINFQNLLNERNSLLGLEEYEIIELKKYYRQRIKDL